MKNKLVVLGIVLALLLTACGGNEAKEAAEGQQGSVSATEEQQDRGTVIGGVRIIEAGQVTGKVNFASGDFLRRTEGDQVQLLDMNGVAQTEKLYDEFKAIVGNGVCVVSMDSDDVPRLGVVNAYTGQELVSCEAAEVRRLSDRYLLIRYYTGEATQEEYYSYYSDADYNKVYYDGYGKVLDLQEGRFVPGLEVTESVSAAGDMLYVDRTYKETEVFGPDGTSVGTYEYLYAYPQSGIALQSSGTGFTVYDGSFEKVSYVTGELRDYSPIDGVDDMLMQYVSGQGYQLVDLNGQPISKPMEYMVADDSVQYVCHGTLEEDGLWGAMDREGNVLVPFEYEIVHYVEPGYLLAFKTNETSGKQEGDVYSLTGEKLNSEPVSGYFNECAFYTSSGIFAPETGKVIPASNRQYLGCGLIKVQEDTYNNTIYSAITGEVVFEEVEACVCTGSNLYIWNGEEQVYYRYIIEFA